MFKCSVCGGTGVIIRMEPRWAYDTELAPGRIHLDCSYCFGTGLAQRWLPLARCYRKANPILLLGALGCTTLIAAARLIAWGWHFIRG